MGEGIYVPCSVTSKKLMYYEEKTTLSVSVDNGAIRRLMRQGSERKSQRSNRSCPRTRISIDCRELGIPSHDRLQGNSRLVCRARIRRLDRRCAAERQGGGLHSDSDYKGKRRQRVPKHSIRYSLLKCASADRNRTGRPRG